MKLAFLFLLPVALLPACTSSTGDVNPQTTPSVSQTQSPLQVGKTNVGKLPPVIQITEYFLKDDGQKTVTLNGKELKINWRLTNVYDYDAQSRLIRQKTTIWNNPSWWEELSYQYTTDLIERYRNFENKDFQNTLFLNDKGFLKGNLEPGEYVYDTEGYLITYKGNGLQGTYTIKDGNIVAKETVYNSGLIQKNTYEYDLTKPAIPSPLTFRGRQNQNLLIKQTITSTSTNSSDSQTTVFQLQYDFDKQDRPIREFVLTNQESVPGSIREFVYQ